MIPSFTAEKGTFTTISNPKKIWKFHFNPSTISDSHTANWPTSQIPGHSHPVYQYGGSGERRINFTLQLDGDRGKLHRRSPENTRPTVNYPPKQPDIRLRRGAQAANFLPDMLVARLGLGRTLGTIRTGARVAGQVLIEERSPVPAVDTRRPMPPIGDPTGLSIENDLLFFKRFAIPRTGREPPPLVLFSLGQMYRGLPCILEVMSTNITSFTKDMAPVRAEINVSLLEYKEEGQVWEDWRTYVRPAR